jgi:hypothetical protein
MQLDLFQRASATVVAFPPSRHVRLIRHAAEMISSCDHDAAVEFWRDLTKRVGLPLLDAGIPPASVKIELLAFHHAVAAEMARIDPGDPSGNRRNIVGRGGSNGQVAPLAVCPASAASTK